jgi:hypothetical protein
MGVGLQERSRAHAGDGWVHAAVSGARCSARGDVPTGHDVRRSEQIRGPILVRDRGHVERGQGRQ